MVQILDSTLREGEQTPGVYFSPETKLLIAEFLDQIGVDIIEAGNPTVSSEIAASIGQIVKANFKAKIGAHSLCRIDHVQRALDCGVDFLGVFFSVSQQRLERDYQIPVEAALDRIFEVIHYARQQRPDLVIRYTPEDTVRSAMSHVIQAAIVAVEAGADIISIADTTGYATPFQADRSYAHYVNTLKDGLAQHDLYPAIEAHCHNDRGLALANALDAYHNGADIIDTSVMGLGERAGIVDLAALLVNLIEMGEPESTWNLAGLKELYHLISRYSHISPPPHSPVVGKNAFTHYSGVHVRAIARDESLYQSLNIGSLGIKSDLALGVQSGRAAVELAMHQIGRGGLLSNPALINRVLQAVKELAKRGTLIDIDTELPSIVDQCIVIQMMTEQTIDH